MAEYGGVGDILAELDFLKANPHFEQRPATILEFLGPKYLNIDDTIRPGIRQALVDVFGSTIDSKFISRVRRAMITGGIGIGKLLRPDAPVLTPAGWVEIDRLNEGDLVIGRDGNAYPVTGVYRHENVQLYRMFFKDGTWIDSGDEHLWEVHESKVVKVPGERRTERKLIRRVMSTEDLYNEPLKKDSSYRFRIPLMEPVDLEPVELPLAPWLLGALIANGSFTHGTPSVATDDAWVGEKIESLLPGATVKYYDRRFRISYSGNRAMNSNPVQAAIRELGLEGVTSRDKFIPEQYLRGAAADRLELLRGLMDNDGSSVGNNRSDYSTSSKQLSEDVAYLVRSLGGYATITNFERNGAVEYQVHVNMDQVCPFAMPRKVARWKPRTNQRPARSIVNIKKIERGDGVCISIDSPDKLYVTKDFIVTHNTTIASIIMTYMVHWVTCLKDPQGFFNLMPGSRIAFMLMSTKDSQAKEVLFGDIKARIEPSPWFKQNAVYDPNFKNQLRFDKDIWVIPGNSAETSFEGYNILGGILDEGDSHRSTSEKDFAEAGYDTIHARINSRFNDPATRDHRGLLVVIGQMKKESGFMARKKKELEADQNAMVVTMTIWEALGWEPRAGHPGFILPDGTRDSFFYDHRKRQIIPRLAAAMIGGERARYIIEIPNAYKKDFETNPAKALRDLAGMPPSTDSPFISQEDKIIDCTDRWKESHWDVDENGVRVGEQPIIGPMNNPALSSKLRARDSVPRYGHLDIATSGDGDALGFAIGHVSKLVEIDDEVKPYIVIDMLLRIKARPGEEIILSDFRRIVYDLRDERKFRIKQITLDGFQSTDTRQQFNKRKIASDYLSVDKTTAPYYDLREAILEGRIEFPPYMTKLNHGDLDDVDIVVKELRELSEVGHKIDHPTKGSKDVADAIAGVVHTLMNVPGASRLAKRDGAKYSEPTDISGPLFGTYEGSTSPGAVGGSMSAPLPPLGLSSLLDGLSRR